MRLFILVWVKGGGMEVIGKPYRAENLEEAEKAKEERPISRLLTVLELVKPEEEMRSLRQQYQHDPEMLELVSHPELTPEEEKHELARLTT